MSTITGPVHLVGAGGIHMSAIGQLLREQGVAVTGSDLVRSHLTDHLEALGAVIHTDGHAAANVGDAALVVYTAAAKEDNPELVEARRRGIPVILRAEMVARLVVGKRVIAIAGSHGKTTTSSLVAFILRLAGRDPMFLLGGESPDLGGHCAWGSGDLCVVEADEYRRAFHEYDPAVAVITNVEPDHLDIYGTAEAYAEAFAVFAARIVPGGVLYVCGDDAGAAAVAATAPRYTFGLGAGNDWRATAIDHSTTGTSFTLEHDGAALGRLTTSLPGDHFVVDTVVAAAVCLDLGVPFAQVQEAVARFRGARRRFEIVGEVNGVTVIDDYAHHPTEARKDLRAARDRFAGRRLVVLFQPHTYTRTAYLWDDWLACWEDADELVIVETYAAREEPIAGANGRALADAIPGAGYAETFDDAVRIATEMAQPGDVIFTMGAGDITEVGPRIVEALA